MKLSIKRLFATFSKNDPQHNNTVNILNVVMLCQISFLVMPNVIVLSVVMLSAVILSGMAPLTNTRLEVK
jgi:hypothetical protein